ncbi:MAG: hypothetical protein Tsb0020_28930 [Haliangiales bacterium]
MDAETTSPVMESDRSDGFTSMWAPAVASGGRGSTSVPAADWAASAALGMDGVASGLAEAS